MSIILIYFGISMKTKSLYYIALVIIFINTSCTSNNISMDKKEEKMVRKGSKLTEEELQMTEEEFDKMQMEQIKKEQDQRNKEFAEKNDFPKGTVTSGSKIIKVDENKK